MRTIINRNTRIDILGNRQDRIVVAAGDVLRNVTLAQPVFSGQLFQAMAGYPAARKRSVKPAAAAAARAVETATCSLVSSTRGPSRCWHTHVVMPDLRVARVGS